MKVMLRYEAFTQISGERPTGNREATSFAVLMVLQRIEAGRRAK